MEQCGDDEDFLRELLSDLRGEVDAQLVKIDEVLSVSLMSEDFLFVVSCAQVLSGVWLTRELDFRVLM